MPTVDDVFTAVANRHRRRLLDLLLDEPQSVNALAVRFDMRRPSVSEHLKVLKDAGLVREERHGRERIYHVDAQRLRPVAEWLSPYEVFWRDSLRDLRDHLDRNP
ncbi:metalloregulator ArsR/SmtB family transcription factor [Lipingzhangella sp. LS1_29]|uniref:Metalloregulator ArsR/SmtB family transcription factor n=1 Tax=Lipingzhangella rawalii TaxID=2055835 RepID=A0ABU2HCQ5_9ACTN|nr:metalloregulator ArsR/SmtB family transcription factor [Lipingzhangella rawalii]MDS1272344.1 metalloregulator ArsR/SmtB family transcription factor [Lipingzhangella rawalii]